MTAAEAEVWAGYVASEQIRLLIQPVLERSKGRVATHYANCHEFHVECLAARINDLIATGEVR